MGGGDEAKTRFEVRKHVGFGNENKTERCQPEREHGKPRTTHDFACAINIDGNSPGAACRSLEHAPPSANETSQAGVLAVATET